MLDRILGNMGRQEKGLEVLFSLLEEEFSLLRGHDPRAVSACEFSIQELLRQIAAERGSLRGQVRAMAAQAKTLRDLLPTLEPEQAEAVSGLMGRVDAMEQRCAVQAEKNSQLALALAEQSKSMLDFMHKQIQPRGNNTYSHRGRVSAHRPEAALFHGRS